MLNHIKSIQVKPDYHLQLTYEDGEVTCADFRPIIHQGGVFSSLADPEFFGSATLDAYGRAVVWPGELEFCADALKLEGEWRESNSPGSPFRRQQDNSPARLLSELTIVEDR